MIILRVIYMFLNRIQVGSLDIIHSMDPDPYSYDEILYGFI